jgi:predicted nucleic acid-binding protein
VKICPDTNCWIEGGLATGGRARVFLVTIVLQELWAGARRAEERAYVERLHALAWQQRRLLNPPAGAWTLAGQVLGVLARSRRFGPGRLRALRNDVLLAATAFVHGAAVMTRDRRDFARIAEVLPVRVVGLGEGGKG